MRRDVEKTVGSCTIVDVSLRYIPCFRFSGKKLGTFCVYVQSPVTAHLIDFL